MATSVSKVLVVEDDADGASILEAYLRRDGFDVLICGDGSEAVDRYASWGPDLVLLDMMLPGLNGIDVLAALRRRGDTPVIMVTAIGDEPEKLGALRFGADDYVVKPYNPKEVVARVHAVLRRASRPTTPSTTLQYQNLSLDLTAFRASVHSLDAEEQIVDLTPTEFSILATLLRAPTKAFSRHELIERCLPDSDALERVVDAHVHNLRKKLELHNISGILVTVRSVGYRFR